jgi:hypothetical protein
MTKRESFHKLDSSPAVNEDKALSSPLFFPDAAKSFHQQQW